MSRSNGVSFFDDAEIGEIERSEPGASGMMGGSVGNPSGIALSENVNGGSALP
jgi:hypothetical protein